MKFEFLSYSVEYLTKKIRRGIFKFYGFGFFSSRGIETYSASLLFALGQRYFTVSYLPKKLLRNTFVCCTDDHIKTQLQFYRFVQEFININ